MSTITDTHLSFVQRLEDILHDFEVFAGLAAKYAPAAGALAEAVEVASGNPELVPVTAVAVAATEGVGGAAASGDLLSTIAVTKDAVQAVKDAVTGNAIQPKVLGGPGPVKGPGQ